jgi:uncharacterized protein YwgA
MNQKIEIPWHKYGLIAYLSKSLIDTPTQFGKTALEKLIYLIQELGDIDLGYEYRLYTYGPFSAEVLDDLDFTEHIGGVSVKYVESGRGGYDIIPADESEDLVSKSDDFLEAHKAGINSIVTEFGRLYAKDLELITTIIYMDRNAVLTSQSLSTEHLAKLVYDIKPHFTLATIQEKVSELIDKGYLKSVKLN